jgi:TRAP-type C4-dicarboxylate transport system permease small subunit
MLSTIAVFIAIASLPVFGQIALRYLFPLPPKPEDPRQD